MCKLAWINLFSNSIFLLVRETVDESLSSILDESGDEEEQEAIVNQVLDEIGIEIGSKVWNGTRDILATT